MRNTGKLLLFVAGALVPLALWRATRPRRVLLRVVPSLDLERYTGKWYEIARLPHRYQHICDSDVTAIYTPRPDGKVAVRNECRAADGTAKSVEGIARPASRAGPTSKLKVSFFRPLWGDYWVLDLDPDYRWAAVGEPGRRYFWVLSREPRLDRTILAGILDRARDQGYDLTALRETRHSL